MPNILDYLQARAEAAPAPDEVTDAEALEIILGGDDDGDEA